MSRNIDQYIRPIKEPLPKGGDIARQIRTGRLQGKFLPPIPLWWITQIFEMALKRRTPRTIIVGLILWQQMKMKKSQPFSISNAVWRGLRLERRAVGRALASIENAGLIRVERFKHKLPKIIIVTS